MLDLVVNDAWEDPDYFTWNVINMKTIISRKLVKAVNNTKSEWEKEISHERLVRELLTRLSNSTSVRYRSCCIDWRDDREIIPWVSVPWWDLWQLWVMFAVMRYFERKLKKFWYDVDELWFSLHDWQNIFNDIAIKSLLQYLKWSDIPFWMHIDDHHIWSTSEIWCWHFDLLVRTKNLDSVLWDSYWIRLSDIIDLNKVLRIFATKTIESVNISWLPKFDTIVWDIHWENKILKWSHQECCVVVLESDEFTLRHSNLSDITDNIPTWQIFVYHKTMAEKRNLQISEMWSSEIINHLLSKIWREKIINLFNQLLDVRDENEIKKVFTHYLYEAMNTIMFDHLVQTWNNLVKSWAIPVYSMKVDNEWELIEFSKITEVWN